MHERKKQETLTLTERQKHLLLDVSKQANVIINKIRFKEEIKSLGFFVSLLSLAVIGRIALQHVPSIEPIIPLAIIAGILFGLKEGFIFGSTAYIISNFFVWGMQGPWTVFQALGAGIAGSLGFFLKDKKVIKPIDLILFSVIGTIIFEIIMNISGSILGIGFFTGFLAIPLYFLTSLPFGIAHVAGNVFFARIFYPIIKFRRYSNEIKIYSIRHFNGLAFTSISLHDSEKR